MSDQISVIEWMNDPRTREQEKGIAQLIQRGNRLARAYRALEDAYVNAIVNAHQNVREGDASMDELDRMADETRQQFRQGIETNDLYPLEETANDGQHFVTVKIPQRVWDWWSETSRAEDVEEEIRLHLIECYKQDQEADCA